jgi:hypothetical protein
MQPNDLGARLDRFVLVGFDLREFVQNRLRQFALFEIKNTVVPEQKTTILLAVVLVGVEVLVVLLRVLDLPENHDGALLTFANTPAKFVGLPHRQPIWLHVFGGGE